MNQQEANACRDLLSSQVDDSGFEVVDAVSVFAICDALKSSFQLRKMCVATSFELDARQEFCRSLFNGKALPGAYAAFTDGNDQISGKAVELLASALKYGWGSGSQLIKALEYQGARALLRCELLSQNLDNVREDIYRFGRVIVTDAQLRAAIENKLVDLGIRKNLVGNLVEGKVQAVSKILLDRALVSNDSSYVAKLQQYLDLASDLRGRKLAKVFTATEMSVEQLDRLRVELSRIYGANVDLEPIVDPSVMGGVEVHVDGEMINGTIRGRLAEAQRLLDR